MIEVDKETRGFRPTIEWMSRRYNEMNHVLFDGSLGSCKFDIFTSGKGSQGRTLGTFHMKSTGLKCDRYSRRMYKLGYYDKIYIDADNFAEVCNPTISLNGNYTGTEYGFLATLVHEMCHYYTYMKGYAPTRGHGREFYSIGNIVSSNSDGLFNIQRLASAEDMKHLDLSDEMKARNEKRIANKKSSVYALFDYRSDNDIRLSMTSSQSLIDTICNFEKSNKTSRQVIITNDSNVINSLFEMGYKKNFRTWRYWQVSDKFWLPILDNADKEIKRNPNFMNENKGSLYIDDIISEALNKFISERVDNDLIDISPDMDLGAYSPLEIE
jgi:hypothetical protein